MGAEGNYIVESDVDNWPTAVDTSETFATTAVVIATDRITVVNDIATCTELQFSSTGEVPAPLVTGTIYYAIRINATTIEVATTAVLAAAGTAVNLTDVGTGTHTLDVGDGSSTTERQETIDAAETLIEQTTHDYFYSKAFVEYFNGNGKNRLSLGLIPTILTVTEILLSGVELISSWYTNNDNAVYLDPETTGGADTAESYYRSSRKKGMFPRGNGNIKITGTFGWSSCPIAIKKAAIVLCRFENDNTLYTSYDDLSSEKIGEQQWVRGVAKKYLTGIQEADRLIHKYIRNKPVFGVA